MLALGGGVASAADVSPSVSVEVQRGVAAVGARDSAAPALRTEGQAPSAGFAVGAALAAWRNASSGLMGDAAHPLGDGGEAGTLRSDCFDEKLAFGVLEAARAKLAASPAEVARAAGLGGEAASAWIARREVAPAPCR